MEFAAAFKAGYLSGSIGFAESKPAGSIQSALEMETLIPLYLSAISGWGSHVYNFILRGELCGEHYWA